MSSAKLPRPRTRPKHLEGTGRMAAVMLLVYPNVESQLQTVLTRRKDNLQHHPGQISLPGGRRDEGESIEQTATREVEEEIGIRRDTIVVLGMLNSIYVPPSDFMIFPFVGWLDAEPEFELQVEEVADLIQVPLSILLDPSIRRCSSVASDPVDRDVPWYAIAGHQVWGATAMILDDFSQRLTKESSEHQ